MRKLNRYDVLLVPKVTNEFWEAFLYYNNISVTLSQNFSFMFEVAIEKLSISPHHYYKLTKKLRRIRLGKFPYLLVYSVSNRKMTVTVYGLFHTASNPAKWRRKRN